jgi:hypothetical protein
VFGIGTGLNTSNIPERRETKQEKEARRLERERQARVEERERSIREEHVDGGYLVTMGVYTGIEDFNKAIVRQLMVCMDCAILGSSTDVSRLNVELPHFGVV